MVPFLVQPLPILQRRLFEGEQIDWVDLSLVFWPLVFWPLVFWRAVPCTDALCRAGQRHNYGGSGITQGPTLSKLLESAEIHTMVLDTSRLSTLPG
jgi:hypothetical protein